MTRACLWRSGTGTHAGYVQAVADAARQLMSERLLIEGDVQRYIDEAENSDVLR